MLQKKNNFLTHDPTFEIFLLVHSNILTLQNQVASPKGKPAAFFTNAPLSPLSCPMYMADVHNGAAPPITREMYKSTAAVLPSPAADFTRISFPAGCGVQSQPPHPGGSSQDQGGEECTLELVGDWRRGSTVHHQLLPQGWGWWMQLLLRGLRRNCNSDAPSFNLVSHKTSFSKKYMFEHIEDIGPAVRPTLIISFGQMNRGGDSSRVGLADWQGQILIPCFTKR